MASTGKGQPEWHTPVVTEVSPSLKLNNSLTRSKTEFLPRIGKQVTWYNCGPTVYDAAHIGHARLYVSIDILRRVLSEYFNYDILFVMNITDIDDKIILRARQNVLFDGLREQTGKLTSELIKLVRNALADFTKTKLAKTDAQKQDPKYLMHTNSFRVALEAVADAELSLEEGNASKEAADKLLDSAQDVVFAWLDKEKGASITDPKLFRDLAAHWEQDFMKDMDALNVRPCDVLTRVSEYIPEIVKYVQKIMDNGYAYLSEGSVYFDTQAFDGRKGHHYAKLEPWSAGNLGLIEEGEGSLGSKLLGKKNSSDFALWKKSKPGEPAWESPWGAGRPGWHIECSVMASEILGDTLDIHSGGIDLAFPHHDNELAQSEAYHGCVQWINFFLHVGHLHIEGQKMSKSLKNFITIKDALKKYTSRQLRLCFLLHQWDSKLDFKDSVMVEAKGAEITINNFFANVKALLNEHKRTAFDSDGKHRYHYKEADLIKLLQKKEAAIHNALCDSVNTPLVMAEILDLISKTNVYLGSGRGAINIQVVQRISKYVTKILRVFGLIDDQSDQIGWSSQSQSGETKKEDIVMPYLHVLSSFRDSVRDLSRQQKPHSELLALCDKLRDNELVELGVSLDDQDDGKALVKLVDREQLIEARQQRLAAQAEKAAKKEAAARAREEEKRQKLEKGKISPEDMFKGVKDDDGNQMYTTFDEQGVPTHDKDGQELSKNSVKKLKKQWEAQQKLHAEYQAWAKETKQASETGKKQTSASNPVAESKPEE